MSTHAEHGGASFGAIGYDFSNLDRKADIVDADVLDAWFPPSPLAIDALRQDLEWLVKISPPTWSEGLLETLETTRGVAKECLITGPGTSSLMYLALPELVRPNDKVVVLEPTYSEYPHLAREVLHAKVDAVPLHWEKGFRPNFEEVVRASEGARMVLLVNPNSPTGVAVPKAELLDFYRNLGSETWLWVDETYIDYFGYTESLESALPECQRLIVCKSMSKFYGLSGLRVGYLAAHPNFVERMQPKLAPWGLGTLAQLAAIRCLQDRDYYDQKIHETRELRSSLAEHLASIPGLEVLMSDTNFLMIKLANRSAATVVQKCRQDGVWLRNCDSLSASFQGAYLRTSVKDEARNQRIVSALRKALHA